MVVVVLLLSICFTIKSWDQKMWIAEWQGEGGDKQNGTKISSHSSPLPRRKKKINQRKNEAHKIKTTQSKRTHTKRCKWGKGGKKKKLLFERGKGSGGGTSFLSLSHRRRWRWKKGALFKLWDAGQVSTRGRRPELTPGVPLRSRGCPARIKMKSRRTMMMTTKKTAKKKERMGTVSRKNNKNRLVTWKRFSLLYNKKARHSWTSSSFPPPPFPFLTTQVVRLCKWAG